ncbi:hypothetical protein F4560_002996 [Saccharothrix ecbatanensis]|uniref:Uncharacterized protein n=1 Tax=Saccharothrix ecbatanensis TaxID=1105145 RepID=A0A7W9HJS5_9PSEU|nr:hypothetical protein [Saccharothrix ecbatanensis]MBB5803228.1 hypothetical protein [Saccharothrix ecbatanensis]
MAVSTIDPAAVLQADLIAAAADNGSAVRVVHTGTVRVTYSCTLPERDEPISDEIEFGITAPVVIRRGAYIDLWLTLRTLHGTKFERPANDVTGHMGVVVAGPVDAEPTAYGLTNVEPARIGHGVLLSGAHTRFLAEEPGLYTFAPGHRVVVVNGGTDGPRTICDLEGRPVPATQTLVV